MLLCKGFVNCFVAYMWEVEVPAVATRWAKPLGERVHGRTALICVHSGAFLLQQYYCFICHPLFIHEISNWQGCRELLDPIISHPVHGGLLACGGMGCRSRTSGVWITGIQSSLMAHRLPGWPAWPMCCVAWRGLSLGGPSTAQVLDAGASLYQNSLLLFP